jgi:outer membrane protein TolC
MATARGTALANSDAEGDSLSPPMSRVKGHRTTIAVCLFGMMAAAVTAGAVSAQTAAGNVLTLDQALRLAETRSESIAIAGADVRRASAEQLRARSGLWPQLNLSAGYERALASEFSNLFSGTSSPFGGDALGGDVRALPFGRTNTWRVNLSFSQNLFSGGRLTALSRMASAGRQSAELELTTTHAQVLFDVTQAYYDAALSDRLVTIAEATVRQAQSTLEIVQAGYRAGTQPEFELLRARVARDNQTPALIRQRANRDIAILRLEQLLDLPATTELRLADSLETPALPAPPAFASRLAAVETALHSMDEREAIPADAVAPDRTVVKEASTFVRLREASVSAARAERMPAVTLTSNYGRVGYPTRVLPGPGDFRTNWTVGATAQMPIFTGGRLRAGVLIAQAGLDQSRAQLRQTEELAELDTRSAMAQLIAARAAWEASGSTVEQASRAYGIAEVRYRAGVSTQLELTDSRLLFQQAALNRAQAARDLQVARARIALLPDLPIGAGQGSGVTPPQLPQQVPVAPASPSAQPGTQPGAAGTPTEAAFNSSGRPQ